ncbi:MAG: DUF1573 domain-containing protein [Flavobacteriales bacterium]|nr:DUF1573 domain-containing protein [Flavobacteriales bacterium]
MKLLIQTLFLALVPLALLGQNVKWETTSINFGTVRDWNSPEATFKFTNTGKTKLMFLPQKHSRDVLVRYPNRAFQPGESGEITIQYYTSEQGAFSKTVEVYTNVSNRSQQLTVKGNIKSIYANALTSCPSFQDPAPAKSSDPNVVQVVDAATNRPIPNAKVEVFDRGIRKAMNGTNLEGVAVNWIESGKYVAVASKLGYEKAEQEIVFTKRDRTQVIYLNRRSTETEINTEELLVAVEDRRDEVNEKPDERYQTSAPVQEVIDLGITTNDVLENEREQLDEIDLGITINQVMSDESVDARTNDFEDVDLGISSNEQWEEPEIAGAESNRSAEEVNEEDIDLGVATNDQLEEENVRPLATEVELSEIIDREPVPIEVEASEIENEVEAALAEAERNEVEYDLESESEPEFSNEKYRPNNVLLLLDVSGSMNDDGKMDKLKSSIRRLVMMLREVDVLTMIAYNSDSWELLPPTPVKDNLAILALVDSLEPFGYTNGVKGMETAYESLEKQLIQGGNNQLIIATDGKFNSSKFSEKDAIQLVKDNSDKGIVLSIIGFGEDKEAAKMMNKLAEMGDGNFLQVRDDEDPTELLAEEIKNRSRVLGETH